MILLLTLTLMLIVLLLPISFWARLEGEMAGDLADWVLGALSARWELALAVGGRLFWLRLAGEGRAVTAREASLFGRPLHRRHRQPPVDKQPRRRRGWKPGAEAKKVMLQEGLRLAYRLWRRLHLRILGEVRYGTGDPAWTGLLLGAAEAVGKPAGLILRPDFMDPRLGGWVELRGRTHGIEMLAAVVAALFRPAVRRWWWPRIKPQLFRGNRLEGGRA